MTASGSEDETRKLGAKIEAALRSRLLTDWERKFLNDMNVRVHRYRSATRLSVKQDQIIQRILAKVEANNPERPPNVFHLSEYKRLKNKVSFRVKKRWRPSRYSSGLKTAAFLIALVLVLSVSKAILYPGSPQYSGAALDPLRIASGLVSTFAGGGISVVDGDTVRVRGERARVRLVGFNAPETLSARCAYEKSLGDRATARLKQLIAEGKPELTKVACACPPGTEGTQQCNFGRSCGVLRVNGRDVGDILMSEGLAVGFTCGATSCPRMPRPWCS